MNSFSDYLSFGLALGQPVARASLALCDEEWSGTIEVGEEGRCLPDAYGLSSTKMVQGCQVVFAWILSKPN